MTIGPPPAPWRLILSVGGRAFIGESGESLHRWLPAHEERGPIVEAQLRQLGDTFSGHEFDSRGAPLHAAVRLDLPQVVRYLLTDKRVDPNGLDPSGRAPLHLARNPAMLALLADLGADTGKRSSPEAGLLLPLQHAMLTMGVEGARALQGRGAALDPALDDGRFVGTLIAKWGERLRVARLNSPPDEANRFQAQLAPEISGLLGWLDANGVDLGARFQHEGRRTTAHKMLAKQGWPELEPWLLSMRARRAGRITLAAAQRRASRSRATA